jgi:phosphoribosylanthranilate isomerase
MKKSELRQLIREEISKVVNENEINPKLKTLIQDLGSLTKEYYRQINAAKYGRDSGGIISNDKTPSKVYYKNAEKIMKKMTMLKRRITPLMNKQGKFFKDIINNRELRSLLDGYTPPEDLFKYNNYDDIKLINNIKDNLK